MNISVVLIKNDRLYHASADRGTEISFGSGKKIQYQPMTFFLPKSQYKSILILLMYLRKSIMG